MINNCIICLGAGKSQLPIILIAKKMGFYVICIDRDAHSIGFSHAHKSIVISTYEVKLVIDSIGKLQSKYNIIGVVARSSGPALYTAAAIAEFFKLPGLS
ncbi:MAG: hypothetical protein HOG49_17370, partial [Candidatus Scalindua sp.]|nr:hypothetical protein [Candidatus Scalindua sp.]